MVRAGGEGRGDLAGLSFRAYRTGDLDGMYRLDLECFEPAFRFSRRAMRGFAEAPESVSVVAETAEKLAGFAIAEVADGAGYVVTLDVAAEWRGRGLGRRLMLELEGNAGGLGAAMMMLHVFRGNVGAVRLYEILGYRRTGLAQGFYGAGLDAFVYEKALG